MTNLADQTAQTAANTPCSYEVAPLEAFRINRVHQIFDGLELPSDPDELSAYILGVLETVYETGFRDASLRLGEL